MVAAITCPPDSKPVQRRFTYEETAQDGFQISTPLGRLGKVSVRWQAANTRDRELLDIQQYLDYRTAVWTSFPPCRPLVDFAVITTQLYVDLILTKAYVSENVLPPSPFPDELSRIIAKANTLGEITQLYATASPDQDHTELNKRVIALLTRIRSDSP